MTVNIDDIAKVLHESRLDDVEKDYLSTYTIYKRSGRFVLCRWIIDRGDPKPKMDDTFIIVHDDIDVLRDGLRMIGLVCLNRNEEDDPEIVETWI